MMIVALVGALLVPFSPLVPVSDAQAVSGSDFDPGNIISDANFYNGSAMSEVEIQQFLERTVGSCQNSNCLAAYRADTPTRTWSFGTCSTYHGGAGETAARIIFKVQQACNLSAKVILVTLQKEQSLLTDRAPSDGVMRKAMGYGCPDTSTCDSTYYGFFNQVFAAGRQLTWYGNPAGSFTSIRVGAYNAIRYHPNAACGSRDVLVRNRATAALYYYTPYTPNAAALANLGGLGDGCSAYGNRNFWVFYNNWFGSPTTSTPPIGNVELIQAAPGVVKVVGWALQPGNTASIQVHVYVGSVGTAYTASGNRPDVDRAHGLGAAHGFAVTAPVGAVGSENVCVYAINPGAGGHTLLRCQRLAVMGGSPVGAIESVATGQGTVTVKGWAFDPDQTGASRVHVYVDAAGVEVLANRPSPGLDARYPGFGYGDAHGFQAVVNATPGLHTVCAYGINTGNGGHTELGCRTISVLGEAGRAPIGNVEQIGVEGEKIRVTGWAIDPDTADPIAVHVYVGSTGHAFTAQRERADVGRLYPAYGTAHGFSELVDAPPGRHDVCVYAINTGAGGHTPLRCQTVTVVAAIAERGRAPIGALESATVDAGGITMSGWAIDPDTAASVQVHLYVDSNGTAITANGDRPDVGARYPGYGNAHGFSSRVSASPGLHTVCAYAINTGPGGHAQLGCLQVAVPGTVDLGRVPFGNVEAIAVQAGGVNVIGWAIDPDTDAAIAVHVYVDSVGEATIADIDRPDVGRAYPYGTAHGFAYSMAASTGPHTVCVYAINNGRGGHTLLNCTRVVVP
ncbi:hypothetical protein [Agromyces ramosus]|uniref:hypothetical protein n=1 Tax=Agromyces ramosus TaxID=33879 RepID=UPI0027D7BE81|nr:hypothetical protein [Agromyces ramosus]